MDQYRGITLYKIIMVIISDRGVVHVSSLKISWLKTILSYHYWSEKYKGLITKLVLVDIFKDNFLKERKMLGPGEDNCDITGILYQIIKSGSMVAGSI